MAIADANFGNSKDPYQELQKVLTTLEQPNVDAEVAFMDKDSEETVVTRTLLELVIQKYSLSAQNPQMYNKWLAIDEKVNKAIRQFKSDILMLLTGQAQIGQAQASLQAEAPAPPPAPTPTPPAGTTPPSAPQGAADKGLPVNQK